MTWGRFRVKPGMRKGEPGASTGSATGHRPALRQAQGPAGQAIKGGRPFDGLRDRPGKR